jgi:hypothetical protein
MLHISSHKVFGDKNYIFLYFGWNLYSALTYDCLYLNVAANVEAFKFTVRLSDLWTGGSDVECWPGARIDWLFQEEAKIIYWKYFYQVILKTK